MKQVTSLQDYGGGPVFETRFILRSADEAASLCAAPFGAAGAVVGAAPP